MGKENNKIIYKDLDHIQLTLSSLPTKEELLQSDNERLRSEIQKYIREVRNLKKVIKHEKAEKVQLNLKLEDYKLWQRNYELLVVRYNAIREKNSRKRVALMKIKGYYFKWQDLSFWQSIKTAFGYGIDYFKLIEEQINWGLNENIR